MVDDPGGELALTARARDPTPPLLRLVGVEVLGRVLVRAHGRAVLASHHGLALRVAKVVLCIDGRGGATACALTSPLAATEVLDQDAQHLTTVVVGLVAVAIVDDAGIEAADVDAIAGALPSVRDRVDLVTRVSRAGARRVAVVLSRSSRRRDGLRPTRPAVPADCAITHSTGTTGSTCTTGSTSTTGSARGTHCTRRAGTRRGTAVGGRTVGRRRATTVPTGRACSAGGRRGPGRTRPCTTRGRCSRTSATVAAVSGGGTAGSRRRTAGRGTARRSRGTAGTSSSGTARPGPTSTGITTTGGTTIATSCITTARGTTRPGATGCRSAGPGTTCTAAPGTARSAGTVARSRGRRSPTGTTATRGTARRASTAVTGRCISCGTTSAGATSAAVPGTSGSTCRITA